jgi:hypothetical protein
VPASQVLSRWHNQPSQGENYIVEMALLQWQWRNTYMVNVYQLNKSALRIQHWFFNLKQTRQRVDAEPTPLDSGANLNSQVHSECEYESSEEEAGPGLVNSTEVSKNRFEALL